MSREDGITLASNYVRQRGDGRSGAGMKSEKKEFTLLECVIVVTILVFVAAVAVQNVLHSLKSSEQKTVHAAATDYSSVKNMYAG
jgi:competence protein ComGC